MLIIDSQVHLWAAETPERPWPKGSRPHKPVPFGPDEMLAEMDAAGVDRAIIVPPGWEIYRNDLAIASAQAHPDRFAVVGRLDPLAPASPSTLATWRMQPGMLGLRLAFTSPQPLQLLDDGRLEWVWHDAQAAGVPVYPYRSLHRYIRKAYDSFGPKRLFWGTDLSRSPIPYREHVTMFTEEIPWLTTEDKNYIMGLGVAEWLGWKLS